MFATVDELARDYAVGKDFGVGIDVAEEEVKRGDALSEATLDAIPLLGCDKARQQIVGKDPLGAFFAAVDGEGDALSKEPNGLLSWSGREPSSQWTHGGYAAGARELA